jgi:hypothetical protein
VAISEQMTKKERERGNALFLILIAVALFAALSYAVTQSGRGSGGVNKEQDGVNAGQMIETPAAVQAAITRMVVNGVAVRSITFDAADTTPATNVFDTNVGGGATDVKPPTAACNAPTDCNAWTYVQATTGNSGNFIYGIGSAITTPVGGQAIAVLQGGSGLTLGVCTQVQKGLGFSTTVPPVGVGGPVLWGTNSSFSASGNAATVKSTDTSLDGKAFACFQNTTTHLYAYYHALVEQ